MKIYNVINADEKIISTVTISDTGNKKENQRIASAKVRFKYRENACFLRVEEAKKENKK